MFSIFRPFLFNFDPENAHDFAIKSLRLNLLPNKLFEVDDEEVLNVEVFGKLFSNPIGLAAGFDKSAEIYNQIFKLGFGFVEVGTVTPLPQYGNPKPRVFRLEDDEALINRLGFNNDGVEIVKQRIQTQLKKGILGINIGPNKNTKDQKKDFEVCLNNFFSLADYITINISSPNTEKLRDFHKEDNLDNLLFDLNKLKKKIKSNIPLILKISPDININTVKEISNISLKNNISGLVISNTTDKNRDNLINNHKNEKGGLSGVPLHKISTNLIKFFYQHTEGRIPIIGVGGINSGKAAYEKITAGASLIQLYTGLVYQGPFLIKNIKKELIEILRSKGYKNIKEAVGKSL